MLRRGSNPHLKVNWGGAFDASVSGENFDDDDDGSEGNDTALTGSLNGRAAESASAATGARRTCSAYPPKDYYSPKPAPFILGLLGVATLVYLGGSDSSELQAISVAADFDGSGRLGEGEDRPVHLPAKPKGFGASAGLRAPPPRHFEGEAGNKKSKRGGWFRGGGGGGGSRADSANSPASDEVVVAEESTDGAAPPPEGEAVASPPLDQQQQQPADAALPVEQEASVQVPPPPLPAAFQNLAVITDPPDDKDVPLFWHISGGGVGHIIRNVLACRGAVLASGEGSTEGHGDDAELRVVDIDGKRFVNVDTTTSQGLRRAKDMGLGSSGLADVIMTPLLHPAMDVFDGSGHRARAFSLLRHPVQRAVSTYLNLKNGGDPVFDQMTLDQYAQSEYVESNWMVRSLTGKMDGELTADHLEIAKELLRTRFVIGLLDDKYGSLDRFDRYFGWEYTEEQLQCRKEALDGGEFEESARKIVDEGGDAVGLLMQQNEIDWQLFEFVDSLYRDQGALLPERRRAAARQLGLPSYIH